MRTNILVLIASLIIGNSFAQIDTSFFTTTCRIDSLFPLQYTQGDSIINLGGTAQRISSQENSFILRDLYSNNQNKFHFEPDWTWRVVNQDQPFQTGTYRFVFYTSLTDSTAFDWVIGACMETTTCHDTLLELFVDTIISVGGGATNINYTNGITFALKDQYNRQNEFYISSDLRWLDVRGFNNLPIQPGFYTVVLYTSPTDSTVIDWLIRECDVVNIEEQSIQTLLTYPNPATDVIHFSAQDGSPIYELELIDLSGRSIQKEVVNSEQAQIHVSHLSKGFYMYKALTKKGQIVGRVSVQ